MESARLGPGDQRGRGERRALKEAVKDRALTGGEGGGRERMSRLREGGEHTQRCDNHAGCGDRVEQQPGEGT